MRMPIPLSMILCVLLSPGPSAAQSPDPGTEAQREAGPSRDFFPFRVTGLGRRNRKQPANESIFAHRFSSSGI